MDCIYAYVGGLIVNPTPPTLCRKEENPMNRPPSHLADIRVGGKFRFGRKIGSGSFGEIYLGKERERIVKRSVVCLCRSPSFCFHSLSLQRIYLKRKSIILKKDIFLERNRAKKEGKAKAQATSRLASEANNLN